MFKDKFVFIVLALILVINSPITFADAIIPSLHEAKNNITELTIQFNEITKGVKETITSYKSHKKPVYKDKKAYIESIKDYKEGCNNLLQKTNFWQNYLNEKQDYNSNRSDLLKYNSLTNKILLEIKKLDLIIKDQKVK